jgi:hypothetical protein
VVENRILELLILLVIVGIPALLITLAARAARRRAAQQSKFPQPQGQPSPRPGRHR